MGRPSGPLVFFQVVEMNASLDAKKLISDAAILLALLMIGSAFKAGTDYATAIGVSGLLAIANFWVLDILVKRLLHQGNQALLLAVGFIAKIGLVGGSLFGLTKVFEPSAVLIGFGVVLMAITVRGVADAALNTQNGTGESA